ncbi:hypothetical protein [Parasitella parasitica]|uniref:Uncharacterized protein n=1 Tax=Parasitella parasitica TaxID=35722 RepID=A0A0B7MST2_9FUNG|nr:hypothetical protein [Parasitella parasitica]
MVDITYLNYDILLCIAEYLSSKELSALSQCNKVLYQLQWIDLLWKQYCHNDFSIAYNHPDQTYRQLYLQCIRSVKENKRLPCHHLQQYIDQPIILNDRQQQQLSRLDNCQRCFITGFENLFVCLSSICQHQLICDRHARHHARLLDTNSIRHSLYFKPNMAELFCQTCVDWIGGKETNPAEQYHAAKIIGMWSNCLYPEQVEKVNHVKSIRQFERQLRWKDTPQFIINNPRGHCFITSSWMAEWEMFVEGWTTEPPTAAIDQTILLSLVAKLDSIGPNPFYLHSADSVMIISKDTWDYISKHYSYIKAAAYYITKDDLRPDIYEAFSKTIEFWKKRAIGGAS